MNIKYYLKALELNLEISQSISERIKAITLSHFPNEFGGVLVGSYSENGQTVFIDDFICPKKYKQSPVFFERQTKYINEELRRIYKASKGQIFYIGEWHSHPNMKPVPSLHDLLSMRKLLVQDIKIKNPLLLIVGGTKSDLKIECFLTQNDKLLKYEQSQS